MCKFSVNRKKFEHIQEFKSLGLVVMRKGLLVPILKDGSDRLVWREEGRSWFMIVQTDNIRGLLSIMRIHEIPSKRVRDLRCEKKEVSESVDKNTF